MAHPLLYQEVHHGEYFALLLMNFIEKGDVNLW
jgi:hypothetical protein